eukprot:gene7117-7688_t
MEAYAEHLPPGVINFISGSGRELLSPLMSTGVVDALAFIGGSSAADKVIKSHPNPHRLKVFLQLEGKNLGIVLPDADIKTAVEQITIGSTTYNGQRCTAIKLIFLHSSIVNDFLPPFIESINKLTYGLPWEGKISITPLPELNKIQSMEEYIYDAVNKGGQVINKVSGGGSGCDIHGELMRPAVVYPVTENMKLWHEEQFGPVIPIGIYHNLSEIVSYIHKTPFGQQAAVFTKDSDAASPLIDILSTSVGRININTQCGRSPDTLPFSGRRSSALGTMSVSEALKTFSIETVIAGKHTPSTPHAQQLHFLLSVKSFRLNLQVETSQLVFLTLCGFGEDSAKSQFVGFWLIVSRMVPERTRGRWKKGFSADQSKLNEECFNLYMKGNDERVKE